MVSPRIPLFISYLAIALHILSIALYLIYRNSIHEERVVMLFALIICSGIIPFTLIVRRNFPIILKIYFGIFMLSLPLFIIAPSRMLTILSMGYLNTENAHEMLLDKNYYLLKEQGLIKQNDNEATYKVVKRMGIFNKTLARNIFIGFRPDSAKILFLDEKSEIRLRAFKYNKTEIDSLDITTKTVSSRDTILKIIKTQHK
ncbi:MAG TPA: hypothetical protein DFH96_02605 [Bacteroidetes bacterium]|nr:hypothetical protein [Bacteroidota bacterium]HNN11446.1 hypothetical protein [Bacteroidia bacterium]